MIFISIKITYIQNQITNIYVNNQACKCNTTKLIEKNLTTYLDFGVKYYNNTDQTCTNINALFNLTLIKIGNIVSGTLYFPQMIIINNTRMYPSYNRDWDAMPHEACGKQCTFAQYNWTCVFSNNILINRDFLPANSENISLNTFSNIFGLAGNQYGMYTTTTYSLQLINNNFSIVLQYGYYPYGGAMLNYGTNTTFIQKSDSSDMTFSYILI